NSQVVHEINESVSDTEYFCWNIDLADMHKQIEMEYLTQVLELAHKIPYIYLSQNLSEHQMFINIIKEAGDKFDKKEQHSCVVFQQRVILYKNLKKDMDKRRKNFLNK